MNEQQNKIQSEQNVARFRVITEEMANIYENNNADYNNLFGKTFHELALSFSVSRIRENCDQICYRATRKVRKQVKYESVRDTLVYMANYAVMTLAEITPAKDARNKSIPKSKQKFARFRAIIEEMVNLYEKKNADYGNSFGDTYKQLGLISAVTRIMDKCNRLYNLRARQNQQRVKEESIRDTLIDLANYAVMTLVEIDRDSKANH